MTDQSTEMGGFVVVVVVEFSGDDAVDDLVEQNRDGMEQQIGVVVMVVEVTDVDDEGWATQNRLTNDIIIKFDVDANFLEVTE